jgi:uncharacterized membrane protein YgdD (TMEM256/DUF423 family)
MAANWETAARYHLIHALASILATFMAIGFGSPNLASTRAASTRGDSTRGRIEPPFWFWLPSLCFLLGTLIFSGCLYLMVLGGPKVLGAVVPIGGLLMILGWLILGGVAFRSCTLSESIAGDRSRPPASE